jgi:hypothetical protein
MVMVKPQRWQRWTTPSSMLFACMATRQTGQVFGGLGLYDWLKAGARYHSQPVWVNTDVYVVREPSIKTRRRPRRTGPWGRTGEGPFEMKKAANDGGRCNLFSPKRKPSRQETAFVAERDLLLAISKIQNVGRSKSRGTTL